MSAIRVPSTSPQPSTPPQRSTPPKPSTSVDYPKNENGEVAVFKRIHLTPPQPSASPQLCTPLQSCHSTSTCYFTSTCYSTSTCSRHRNPRVTRTPTPLQVRLTFFSVPRLIMVRLYLMVTLYLMVRLYLMVAPLGGVRRSRSSMHMRCPDGIGREIWDREGRESEGGSRHPSPL